MTTNPDVPKLPEVPMYRCYSDASVGNFHAGYDKYDAYVLAAIYRAWFLGEFPHIKKSITDRPRAHERFNATTKETKS